MSLFSYIVPIRGSATLTRSFLSWMRPLLSESGCELVVVVDGDQARENFQALRKTEASIANVRVEYLDVWSGYGKAANRGAELARGEYVVFLNSDTFPEPGSARTLVGQLEQYPEIGVCQGLLLHTQNRRVQSTGHVFGPCFNNHALMGRGADEAIVQTARDCQALTSAFYAVRREDFLTRSGFDEWYWNSHEGMEFALKMQLEGYRCRYEPAAIAFHIQGGSRDQIDLKEKQQVAHFWSKWNESIRLDLGDLIRQQAQVVSDRRYLAINLSDDLSPNYYLECIGAPYEIVFNAYGLPANLELHSVIAPSLRKVSDPIVFLTNSFLDLSSNRLWFEQRGSHADLVVDRHGNLLTVEP